VVSGSGAANPKTFTAIGPAQPPSSPFPSQPPPVESEQNTQSGPVKIGNGPNDGNCVLYLRENKNIKKLPHGLITFEQKKKIATEHEPKKGSVAIINIGYWGHVALVTKVVSNGNKQSISLEEANNPTPGYWVRTISGKNIKDIEKEAHIVGYYYP
jgi:CHAP domain-containing protein